MPPEKEYPALQEKVHGTLAQEATRESAVLTAGVVAPQAVVCAGAEPVQMPLPQVVGVSDPALSLKQQSLL